MAPQRDDAAKTVTANHKDRILGLPGVTGIFTGEKATGGEKTGQRSVVVSVARKKPLSAIPADERIPATLDGIPTDVIEEVFRPCDAARYDPLKGGASISVTPEEDSAFSSGTAGMIVADVATGVPMILSCWHVLYGAGLGTDGDIVTNPPYAGGDPTPDKVGTTTRFALTSTVDGAVARAAGRSTSRAILDVGTPSAIAPATVDMVVRKRGATTGLTTGVVTATDWSGLIDYGSPVGVVSFENMIRFEGEPGMVLGGDSGSVLVAGDGGGGGAVGGCFVPVGTDWDDQGYGVTFGTGDVAFTDGSEGGEIVLIDPAAITADQQVTWSVHVEFSGPGDGVTDEPIAGFILQQSASPFDFAGVQVQWNSVTNDGFIYLTSFSDFHQETLTDADIYNGFDLSIAWNPVANTVSYTFDPDGGSPITNSVALDAVPGNDLQLKLAFASATALSMTTTANDICTGGGGGQLIVENWVEDSNPGNHTFGLDSDQVDVEGAAHNTSVARGSGDAWTLTGTISPSPVNSTQIGMGVDGLSFEYYLLIYATSEGGGLEVGSLAADTFDATDLSASGTVDVTLAYDGVDTLTATFDGGGGPIVISTTTDDVGFPPAVPLYVGVRCYTTAAGGAGFDNLAVT